MKALITLFVIALCGVIFYSCDPKIEPQNNSNEDNNAMKIPPDTDSVKYIHQELTLEDSTSHWILNMLEFKVERDDKLPKISPRYIEVCFAQEDKNKKETILLIPKGVTNKQQYIINDSNDWCSDKIILHGNILNGSEDTTFSFAVIVDYNNLAKDPDGAKYAYSNSVCKIRITY